MFERDSFLDIRFGESLEAAHRKLSLHGYRFVSREEAVPPLGRVLYQGLYDGMESKIHLEFIRNEFHRSRIEIPGTDARRLGKIEKELSQKFGQSERLTRNRQACTDDSPQDPCFDLWSVDDDTSIILDTKANKEKPFIVVEFFRIL